jgi:acetolactate synthase-1/2/3 large subunit
MGVAEAERASTRTGGSLLVECLLANDISLWTCVPGESYLPVLDAIYEHQHLAARPPIRLITTRHEAAAANMAEAAGKLTQRAAVCLVTRGPGAAHASVAVHTAYQDGTPLIVIAGQVGRPELGREAFQEMDLPDVFRSFTKYAATVTDPGRIPEHVERAVHLAHTGRPGPVLLALPEDVLWELTDASPRFVPQSPPPVIAERDAKTLIDRLEGARRPLLLVGGPGWSQEVGDRVTAFAEANEVPMVSAFRWQDAVDNRSNAYVGTLGVGCNPRLRELVEDSDLIVAFGPRLDDPTTDSYRMLRQPERLLLISQDPHERCRSGVSAPGVHCALSSAAEALDRISLEPNFGRRQWLHGLRREEETFRTPPSTDSRLNLAKIITVIRRTVPDNTVVTTGAGNYTAWVQRFFEFREFGTQLAPRNGAMGYGLPAGLAAAALSPDRPIIAFAGDGCSLMSGSELATAVQFRLRLVYIVINNAMYGTIRMHQERSFPGRAIATRLENPDFVAYARSFGAAGYLVTRTEEAEEAISQALAFDGPALVEIQSDPEQITPDLRIPHLG